jgi:WD40 repeat protein
MQFRQSLLRESGLTHVHPSSLVHSVEHSSALVPSHSHYAKMLGGHEGCVNRMTWSPDGALLASVSDDCTLRLWRTSDMHRFTGQQASEDSVVQPHVTIPTQHDANIFGVAFLSPHDDGQDMWLATGGMDDAVITHTLTRPNLAVYRCHSNRVKQVISDVVEPRVFYSASEDGTIRRFDSREPCECSRNEYDHNGAKCKSGFIDTRETSLRTASRPSRRSRFSRFLFRDDSSSKKIEFKSISQNSVRDKYLAAAGSDAFVRIYDMRMIRSDLCEPIGLLAPTHLKDTISESDDVKSPS